MMPVEISIKTDRNRFVKQNRLPYGRRHGALGTHDAHGGFPERAGFSDDGLSSTSTLEPTTILIWGLRLSGCKPRSEKLDGVHRKNNTPVLYLDKLS